MSSGVALISFTSVSLDALLPLARHAFGRSISTAADAAGISPPLHHMLCIAAMKEPNVKANAASVKPYLNLFQAGFLIGVDERDCAEVLEIASMPSLLMDCVNRDVRCLFISGTLSQWRDALIRGCVATASKEARYTYNLVYKEFSKIGLAQSFEVKASPERPDHTFLLSHIKG